MDPTSAGGGGGQQPNGASGMPCEVASVLAAKCVSCHGVTPVGGAPNSLVTREDLLQPSALGGTIASRCVVRVKNTTSPMPPSYAGDSLTTAEVAALESWVASGFAGGSCTSASSSADAGSDATGGGSGGGATSGAGSGSTGGGAGGGSANGNGGGAGGGSGSGGGTATGGGTGGGSVNGNGGGVGGGSGSGGGPATGGGPANGGGTGGGTATGGGSANGGGTGGGTATGGGGSGTTPADAGTACTTDTWSSYGASFFANTCTSCHHHAADFSTASNVRTNRGTITSRITSGNMPQGTTLSATEKTRILRYLNCGVP